MYLKIINNYCYLYFSNNNKISLSDIKNMYKLLLKNNCIDIELLQISKDIRTLHIFKKITPYIFYNLYLQHNNKVGQFRYLKFKKDFTINKIEFGEIIFGEFITLKYFSYEDVYTNLDNLVFEY